MTLKMMGVLTYCLACLFAIYRSRFVPELRFTALIVLELACLGGIVIWLRVSSKKTASWKRTHPFIAELIAMAILVAQLFLLILPLGPGW